MQKRVLGFLLAALGFGGMFLAGYIFITGTGGRGHLVEITCYMIVGAACFFAGINYIYETGKEASAVKLEIASEAEEIPLIQQQWRTIQVATPSTSATNKIIAGS